MTFFKPRAVVLTAMFISLLSMAKLQAQEAPAGPALTIDASADHHLISPDIYGMAYPDHALATELHLPMNRWGGDATTRYNWQIDRTNCGFDWYFMAGHSGPIVPSAGPDELITFAQSYGGRVLMTVPIIDYIDKATDWDCSFPISLFGPQQRVNPYVHPTIDGKRTDAGNSLDPTGKQIVLTDQQKLRIDMLNTPAYQEKWIAHLREKFGPTSKSGTLYELDNEPSGWNNTHRDVHPGQTGDDELVSRSIKYAEAIKAADPSAMVVGPGDFVLHYQSVGTSGDGKKEHGNLGMGDYYLKSFAEQNKLHGRRLLDYFDEHYYPLGQTGATDDTILEETRSLWDPTYVEKDWYGKWHGAIALIPTFHKWVDKYYPGTFVSISEYGWGDQRKFTDALAEVDVLGIFARESLDMACMFGPPKATDAGANAFRIYRNYDGKGGKFGDNYVKSVSDDQSKLAIYAATRSGDGALTVMVINKTTGDLSSKTAIANYQPIVTAQAYRFSADHPTAIVALPDQTVNRYFAATYPARSATLFIIMPGQHF